MILTVTLNPSIDYLYTTKFFNIGKTNKMNNPTKSIGGKGINAGRVAALMDSKVTLTGFLGGDNGSVIQDKLLEESLFDLDFINIPPNNRNAISIMHDEEVHTEITENGPFINEDNQKKIINKIFSIINSNSETKIICISGSVNTNDEFFYQNMVKKIHLNYPSIKIILDISGKQLENIIKNKVIGPFMIKPNIHEFNDITSNNFDNKNEIIHYLQTNDLFSSIPLVLISCGGDGAVLKHNEGIYNISIPKIDVVNPTGAGDSTVGGFASSLEKDLPIMVCIKYAMACGMSNTKNKEVGKIDIDDVEELVTHIKIDIVI